MVASYLTRRNGRYHFRMRVPHDLISIVKSREIHRSLGTTDGRTAKALAMTLSVKLEAEFAHLRQPKILNSPVLRSANGHMLNAAGVNQTPIPPRGSDWQEQGDRPALAELIDAFIAEKGSIWESRTLQMHSRALVLFNEFVGNKPIDLITRQECKGFKETLEKLPPKWESRFKEKDIREIAALELPPINPATVNRILSPVCSFLNWSVVEGHISANPAQRLRAVHRVRADAQRSAFSPDDLRLLFEQSPMYAGCRSAKHRHAPGSMIVKDSRFWLPLIALFTGMRIEEIAQLRCKDVKQLDYVWIFDINNANGNRLKNQSSQRRIPIHSELLAIGLIQHVRHVEAFGHERLWPEFRRGTHGSYSAAYSKWFGRYKTLIGFTDHKLTFHSFRHTFIDRLKQLDVAEGKIQELVGHANHSITTGRYGKPYRPAALKQVIDALGYGLDLRKLHSGFNATEIK